MARQVKVRPAIPEAADLALASYHPIVRKILFRQGIETPEAAQAFLSPDFDLATGHPDKMADLEKAADMILKTVDTESAKQPVPAQAMVR